MDRVWASSLGASRKLVALSYANSAHDEDGRAWASLAYLERRTGLDRKTIISAVTALETAGILADTGERRGKTSSIKVYLVAVPETELHSSTEIGEKQSQNSQEAVPEFPGSSTENGTQRRTGDVQETLKQTVAPRRQGARRRLNGYHINFDWQTHKFTGIRDDELMAWQEAHPAISVPDQIERAGLWLKANPTKRKSNYERFILTWLGRAQDRGAPIK